MHFYVYYKQRVTGHWIYDRTCGTGVAADARVEYLRKQDYASDAGWQTTIMEGAFI